MVWQIPICLVTAELTTTFQVSRDIALLSSRFYPPKRLLSETSATCVTIG